MRQPAYDRDGNFASAMEERAKMKDRDAVDARNVFG
jgi:hypothetical protein